MKKGASAPGFMYEFPWEQMGNYKYALYLPFAYVVATGQDDEDMWCHHMCMLVVLRYLQVTPLPLRHAAAPPPGMHACTLVMRNDIPCAWPPTEEQGGGGARKGLRAALSRGMPLLLASILMMQLSCCPWEEQRRCSPFICGSYRLRKESEEAGH
jgi:hypothetical protein